MVTFFGSVNALFSGLAFAGLIYAIHLQRKELSLQRAELRLQREEMAASRGELAAQVTAQNCLARATIGQIRVAAAQARIEAMKMKATHNPAVEAQIRAVADAIDKIADELENG